PPAIPGRRLFNGCVLCHEVLPNPDSAPHVTIPVIPDRWLFHARFSHAKHTAMDCRSCHNVVRSHETSDILLPHQSSCVRCHSPQGGVAHNCSFCHGFH